MYVGLGLILDNNWTSQLWTHQIMYFKNIAFVTLICRLHYNLSINNTIRLIAKNQICQKNSKILFLVWRFTFKKTISFAIADIAGRATVSVVIASRVQYLERSLYSYAPPSPVGKGAVGIGSVNLSVAYIANNWRTRRPACPNSEQRFSTFDATRTPVSRSYRAH